MVAFWQATSFISALNYFVLAILLPNNGRTRALLELRLLGGFQWPLRSQSLSLAIIAQWKCVLLLPQALGLLGSGYGGHWVVLNKNQENQ